MATYEDEKTSWGVSHRLNINQQRSEQHLLPLLDKFGSTLLLCYANKNLYGCDYEHWFVKDKQSDWKIEFSQNNAVFHVNVDCNPVGEHWTRQEFAMTSEVKERMKKVCGATNYSLALRNCEHVARYIQAGVWISFQMVNPDSFMRKKFIEGLAEKTKLINTFPDELRPAGESLKQIYEEITDFVPCGGPRDALSEKDEKGYNILLIGPTGAGKSSIINHLYNQKVCRIGHGAKPGTRELHFTQGQYGFPMKNKKGKIEKKMKAVNLIDTIGLCDNMLNPDEVKSFIEESLKTNSLKIDKVLVVCYGRITQEHQEAIKMFLKLLKFKNKYKKRFAFIYSKCDDLTEEERKEGIEKMSELLDDELEENEDESNKPDEIAVAFPPDVTAPTIAIRQDLENLRKVALTDLDSKRISLKKSCKVM